MKMLVLAMVLAIAQTVPPVQRQAPNKQAHKGNQDHEGTNHISVIPLPKEPPPVLQGTVHTDDTPSPEEQGNTEKTVAISKLPTVTVDAGTDWWNRIYVIFTGLLVAVGFGGVYYARKSLKAIESQLRKMGEQVTEMQNAGTQTGQMIMHMKDTAERELRAYVCLADAIIEFRQERAPEVRVSMQNFGKTPAYDLRWKSGSLITSYPWPVTFPELADFPTSVSVFAPGGKPYTMIFKQPTISEQLSEILGTPQATLWVFGNITYRDAFGKSHFTNYRLMFGGTEKVPLRQHPERGYKVALMKTDQQGNDAD